MRLQRVLSFSVTAMGLCWIALVYVEDSRVMPESSQINPTDSVLRPIGPSANQGQEEAPSQSEESDAAVLSSASSEMVLGSSLTTQFLAEGFAKESRDDLWAAEKESMIFDVLPSILGSANSINVHCKTTLCRIEIVAIDLANDLPCQFNPQLGIRERRERMAIMTKIERALDADPSAWLFECDGVAGIDMTVAFDKFSTEPSQQ